MSVNFTHLRLLAIKNIRLQIRSPLWLLMEITLPVLLILWSIFISNNNPTPIQEINLMAPNNFTILWRIKDNCGCDMRQVDGWLEFMEKSTSIQLNKSTDNYEDMKEKLAHPLFDPGQTVVGLEIEEIDVDKKTLKYTLLVGKAHLAATKVNRYGPHLDFYGQDAKAKYVHHIQYMIEDSFQQYVTKSSASLPTFMKELPRPEKIELNTVQSYFYAICPAMFLLIIVSNTKNIVLERQTIKPYLSVMGLTTTTFYLSHCVVTLVEILAFSIGITAVVFYNIPNFPWVLAIVTMILFSFTATAFSAMLASFFSTPATAMQLCVSGWISMSLTPYFFNPDPDWHTGLACAQSLWPIYALHYVFKYMIAISDYGGDVWPGLLDSQWTGQMTIGPLAVLAADSILMALTACIFEKRVFGRLFKFLTKRMQREEKSIPEVEMLSDAEEEFTESDADIILQDVYKEYPNGEKAVNGLDIRALRGQVTVLLGHNGAGKTTTFSMICGVEETTSGSVEICGHQAGSVASRSVIGYCAQVNTLIDQMTVKDHLWLAHGLKQAEGHYWDEGQKLLSALGLTEKEKVSNLSGGQKRKLCVCMALIGNSRVVLLDEPTAGMDPESRRDVEKLLEEVKKDRTILLTTHYMDEAETLGDRIFIIAAGQTVCSGSPQFLKKRFGTGYLLTLVADEGTTGSELAETVEPVVQEYAASARLGEVRGKQVEIAIPLAEQHTFPDLFERIETSQDELQISSFGLSLNSLEQVFLRVCSLTEEKEETNREVELTAALEELYQADRLDGWPLYWSQFRAVIIKKFTYSKRFWSQLVTQIGLPILSIIVGLALYTLADPVQTTFSISTPVGEDMFMQNYTWTQESDNFSQLLGSRGHMVDSSADLWQYLRANRSEDFEFGMIFEERKITLLPNPMHRLSFSSAINTLSRLRLPDGNITVSLDIFNPSDSQDSGIMFQQALLLYLLITIIMSQFIVTLIEDRVSQFAHQQLLMGIKPPIYWLGEVVYSLVFFCFQTAVYVFSATFTEIVSPFTAIKLFALLLLYFWSSMPTVFVFSRFMSSSSKASLVVWILLFGSMPLVMGIEWLIPWISGYRIYINTYQWNPFKMSSWDLGYLGLRLIFPSHTIFELMYIFVQYSNGILTGFDAKMLILMLCFCLFVTGTAGLLIFLLVQLRHIRYSIVRLFKIPCARRHIPRESMPLLDSVSSSPDSPLMMETVDLCKVYNKNCALAHLTMSVRNKEIFGLLGVSGAGKTTAFNIITGQMFATKGTATIDGIDCRKDVILGFCPQFDAIHKDFTGREALTLLARIHGYTDPKKTTDRLLDIVKMTAHGKKRMHRCSGGQRRRISVAAALLPTRSRIIIMDEATAGIDPKARRDIWEVIEAVRNYSAVLMTSHSMDECEALCSRIGILKQGGLATVGNSQTLKSRYGSFYTLTMALPSADMRAKVVDEVARWFPGSILKSDGFSLHLKWQIPKRTMDRWSTVFASCIQLSERIEVADFCLTQSTLQDIFLLLAGENPTPLREYTTSRMSSQELVTSSSNR